MTELQILLFMIAHQNRLLFTLRSPLCVQGNRYIKYSIICAFFLFFNACKGESILRDSALFPIESVSDLKEETLKWENCSIPLDCGLLLSAAIHDSLLINYEGGGHFFRVSSLLSGRSLGTFITKGRGPGEFINVIPFIQLSPSHGSLSAMVYDYSLKKIVNWNISASIENDRTVLDGVFELPRKVAAFPFFSLNNHRYSLIDTGQNNPYSFSEDMTDPPQILLFDFENGVTDSVTLFKPVHYPIGENVVTPKSLFSFYGCINSGKDMICLAMSYFPAVVFADLKTKQIFAKEITGQHHSTSFSSHDCFESVVASESYIYALFSGVNSPSPELKANTLYVFDWGGRLIHHYRLKKDVHRLMYDQANHYLYFYNLLTEEMWRSSMP